MQRVGSRLVSAKPGLLRLVIGLVPVLAAGASAPASFARVWHVSADGSGDAPFIQAAVDSAQNGDVILVGPGAYPEIVHIYEKSLEVRSENGAGVTSVSSMGALEHQVPPDNDIVITGFTITGENPFGGGFGADQVRYFRANDCVISGNTYVSQLNFVRWAVLSGCTFENNIDTIGVDLGGGALMLSSAPNSRGYLIENCVFRNNETTTGAPGDGFGGGGALAADGVENGPIVIRGCLFDGNRAPTGGAAFIVGYVTMTNCTFVNNVSEDGAVFLLTPTRDYWGVFNSIFAFNSRVGLFAPDMGRCGCNAYWENEVTGLEGECSLPADQGWGSFWELDPMFCDPKGDYRLAEDSPLAGPFLEQTHSQCEAPLGAYGPGCQISPVLDATWGQIKARYHR